MSSDEIEFDDDDVIENATLCEACGDITEHEILKEKKLAMVVIYSKVYFMLKHNYTQD